MCLFLRSKRVPSRFRFTLRALMVFVSVASVFMSLKLRQVTAERNFAAAISVYPGSFVEYDYQLDNIGNPLVGVEPPTPNWLRSTFVNKFFGRIRFIKLYRVTHPNTVMTYLPQLGSLEILEVTNTPLSEAEWRLVGGLPNLHELHIYNTPLTPQDIGQLSHMQQLEVIYLYNTEVTADGLRSLYSLVNLRCLQADFDECHVSGECIEELARALPKCDILVPGRYRGRAPWVTVEDRLAP